MAAELAWPDTGPDYEWRRESLLEMDVEPPLAAQAAAGPWSDEENEILLGRRPFQ